MMSEFNVVTRQITLTKLRSLAELRAIANARLEDDSELDAVMFVHDQDVFTFDRESHTLYGPNANAIEALSKIAPTSELSQNLTVLSQDPI